MTSHILAAWLFSGLLAAQSQTPLCDQIKTLTQDPTVAAAHWGVMVTTLDGAPLCGVNEKQLFRPASNNKLYTTSAALALLGPTRTFATTVTGTLVSGVITGDLSLTGGGDANLDSGDLPYLTPSARPKTPAPFAFRDLEDLATQLVAKGVKQVHGDITGDDTLFPWEPYAPSWAADDFVWGYGAPVSALTIADNQLTLTITPGKITGTAGHESYPPATVMLEQNGVAYYILQAQVETRAAKSIAGVQVERLPGSRILRVYGSIAEDASPDVEHIAIDDPAAYAALAFRGILAAHGIAVSGTSHSKHRLPVDGLGLQTALAAKSGHSAEEIATPDTSGGGAFCEEPASPSTLAIHHSAPLSDDVTFTDKVSQNLHAELLLHQLGHRHNFCGQGSNVEGVRTVRAFLLHAGVDPDDLFLFDGSGLSAHDLTTPRALTQVLVYDAKQPWFPTLKSALPLGGVDGSLTSRFGPPNSTLKGRVFAKTGTLGESRALSGYVTTTGGRTLIFSILDDNHPPGNSADRAIMDRIVEAIAAQP